MHMGALAAALGLAAVLPVEATAALKKCRAERVECVLLTVPLDRSGAVPGTVRLRIERHRAKRPVRSPLLVLSGMPGDAATSRYSSGRVDYPLRGEARQRDIIKIDLRGTGRSGPLRCRALESAVGPRVTDAAAKCAASLGARRGFYTARDSAQDIEAMRQALGIEKLALLGGSYGADVAFAYVQRYPDRVDRLALASVSGPEGFDALYRPGFAAIAQAVQVLCRKNRCQHASEDPYADFAAVARRLERGPLTGTVVGGTGRPRRADIKAFSLFGALIEALGGDRNVMGYVHNARRGDLQPLLRYRHLTSVSESPFPFPEISSVAAHAASRCEESQLPWSRATPIGDRGSQAASFVRGLPAGSLSPFGPRTVLQSDIVALCRRWPMASAAPDPPRVLPPIPTLIVASVDDLLAPLSSARAVANLIPGSRLLRLRGAGHDVFGEYGWGSGCAETILQDFLAGAVPRDVCGPEHKSHRGASKPPPLSLAEVSPDRRVRGRPGQILTAVNATLREGAQFGSGGSFGQLRGLISRPRDWRRVLLAPIRYGALRRGSYALRLFTWRARLRGASYVPGVRLSGWVVLADKPRKRRGVIRVWGSSGVRGRLVVRRGVMSGELAGVQVRAPMRLGPGVGFTVVPVPKALRSVATASSSQLMRSVAPLAQFPGWR